MRNLVLDLPVQVSDKNLTRPLMALIHEDKTLRHGHYHGLNAFFSLTLRFQDFQRRNWQQENPGFLFFHMLRRNWQKCRMH